MLDGVIINGGARNVTRTTGTVTTTEAAARGTTISTTGVVLFDGGSQFDTIDGRGRGTWARLGASLGGKGPLLSVYGDFGDVKGWGVRGGFRF